MYTLVFLGVPFILRTRLDHQSGHKANIKFLLWLLDALSSLSFYFGLLLTMFLLRVMSRYEDIADWSAFCNRIEVFSCEFKVLTRLIGALLFGDDVS